MNTDNAVEPNDDSPIECVCCGNSGSIKKVMLHMHIGHPIDCYKCNGTGEQYSFDGVFIECDCGYGCGPKAVYVECMKCGHQEKDMTRMRISSRVRANLRWLVSSRDACTIERIESLFSEGMNWSNRKEWHIDHIKPIKAFLDENVYDYGVINHHKNLQPLWAKDNMSKGASY